MNETTQEELELKANIQYLAEKGEGDTLRTTIYDFARKKELTTSHIIMLKYLSDAEQQFAQQTSTNKG